MKFSILVTVVLAVAGLSGLAFGEEVVHISGVVTERAYVGVTGTERSKIVSPFEATIGPRQWKIITTFGPNHYETVVFDGTNTYGSLHSPDERNTAPGLNDSGNVWPENYPAFAFCNTRVVWLALASSGFISQRTNGFMAVPWIGGFMDEARCYNYEATIDTIAPHLPVEVRFLGSTNLWRKTTQASAQISGNFEILRPAPYPEGFRGGEYRVLRSTNFNGLRFPIEFEVKRYLPLTNMSDRLLLESFHGIATNFSLRVETGNLALPIDRPTDIMDCRFADSDHLGVAVRYTMNTTSTWPAIDCKELLTQAKAEIDRLEKTKKGNSENKRRELPYKRLRWVILAGMLFPVWLIAHYYRKK